MRVRCLRQGDWHCAALLAIFILSVHTPLHAQGGTAGGLSLSAQGPYTAGVMRGTATSEVLQLSLTDAIGRGLKNNLGGILSEQGQRGSQAARIRALAELLPTLSVRALASEQQINLAAFGFSNFPGIAPIVGPFGLVDLRAYLSQRLLDFHAIRGVQASRESLGAAQNDVQDARDTVVLAVGALYLQTLAGESRVDAARAQVQTAQAVYDQSADLKKSGVIPAIDLLRAEVQFEAERQRLLSAENDFEKMKLGLEQAIGLPLAQRIALTDKLSPESLPQVPFDQVLSNAFENRADYRALQARVRAAEFARRAAAAERYPTVSAAVDYGTIGQSPAQNHGTMTAGLAINVPVFDGRRTEASVLQADAELRMRSAQRDALRGRIEYEIRTVFLDLKSALDQVTMARHALDLADAQVTQAQDRFKAGVSGSLEVVQAQQAHATASDNYIASLFAYNLAKGMLARSAGQAEKFFGAYVLGMKAAVQ